MVSIDAARTIGMMKASSVDRVFVDTTVMPKAIAHPTDSRLLKKKRRVDSTWLSGNAFLPVA